MARLIITTVGTSLIEKLGRDKIKGNDNKLKDNNLYNNIVLCCNDKAPKDAEGFYKDDNEDVLSTLGKLKALKLPTDIHFAPAEVASLWKLNLNKEEDTVVLLNSDTPEGVFCSVVLQMYINIHIANCNQKIKIEGLQSEDAKKFKDAGLKNLTKAFIGCIKENEGTHKIILNITGGYKGIIPHLTLMGMCKEGVKMVYLYEESDDLIEIPVLPFNIDFTLWNDNRAFIKTLPKSKGIYEEIDKLPINHKLMSLFESASPGEIKPTIYHEFFEELYLEAKKEKALSEFGRGYILADLIKDKDKKQKLKAWINNSQNIWYGDNIPETVDHSRGHCQRLLELAAQIVVPINQKHHTPFLTDDELIVLTLTLWFHDIGHSGRELIRDFNDETIKKLLLSRDFNDCQHIDISEFPTANRDVHHVLGFIEALKEAENFGFYGTNKSLNGKKDGFLDVEYLKPAIYAYLYHRKKMLAIVAGMPYTFKFGVSITKEIDKTWLLNGVEIRLHFLAALQAFVDECDNSRERTGDAEFKQRRIRQTEKEIKTEYEKLLKLYQYAIKEKLLTDSTEINSVMQLFKKNESFYSYGELLKESNNFDLEIKIDGKKVEDLLNDCIEKHHDINSNPLVYEIATTLNKAVFKLIQNWHFEKSDAYNSVFILPAEGFGAENKYIFDIYIESNKNVLDVSKEQQLPNKVTNGYTITYPADKRKNEGVIGICKQYNIVKSILSDTRISFKYIRWVDANNKNNESIPAKTIDCILEEAKK